MGCAVLPLQVVRAEPLFSIQTPAVLGDIGIDCLAALSSKSSAPQVVMLISPRMVYSMLEWPRMREVALAAGLDVVTWKAPGVPAQEWAQAVGAIRWPPSRSVLVSDASSACTAWLQRPNHFPFSMVALDGQVHGWPIWGVLSDEAWAESLALRLKALKDAKTLSKANPP